LFEDGFVPSIDRFTAPASAGAGPLPEAAAADCRRHAAEKRSEKSRNARRNTQLDEAESSIRIEIELRIRPAILIQVEAVEVCSTKAEGVAGERHASESEV